MPVTTELSITFPESSRCSTSTSSKSTESLISPLELIPGNSVEP